MIQEYQKIACLPDYCYLYRLVAAKRTQLAKTMSTISDVLKLVAILVVEQAKQKSLKALHDIVYQFIRKRFFINESVQVKMNRTKLQVIEVISATISRSEANGDNVKNFKDTDKLLYKLQRIDSNDVIHIAPFKDIHRGIADFSHDKLKTFLEDVVGVDDIDGVLRVKPEEYKKYITDQNINFGKLFVGDIPADVLETSSENNSHLSDDVELKPFSITNNPPSEIELESEEPLFASPESTIDDLELSDQKLMPILNPVRTLMPVDLFGDSLMVMEFINTIVGPITGKDCNVTFSQLSRAFTIREVAGPLSDILFTLLRTVFHLQLDEDKECAIAYLHLKTNDQTKTHMFVKKHYFCNVNSLPMGSEPALTISEVLRLHLLGSGAKVNERCQKWRTINRNGYNSSREDPGLHFCQQFPHILRALKFCTVFQLPMAYIMRICLCLIDQILTYAKVMISMDVRSDSMMHLKDEIMKLIIADNDRRMKLVNNKERLLLVDQMECTNKSTGEEIELQLEKKLNKEVTEIAAKNDRSEQLFLKQLDQLSLSLFEISNYLGMDRAYRRYYIFQSMPGIFVEHPMNCQDDACLKNPPDAPNDNNNNNNSENNVRNEPPQLQAMMCTGRKNCIVHDDTNADRQPWAYLHKKADIDALLDSLNPMGDRESQLLQELTTLRPLIVYHAKNCPTVALTVDKTKRSPYFQMQMMAETCQQYGNANFGFGETVNPDVLNDVMYHTLVKRILQLEQEIARGSVGSPKVKNLTNWRNDIRNIHKNSQITQKLDQLKYGDGSKNDVNLGKYYFPDVVLDSEESHRISTQYDSVILRTRVKNLSSALLQIEQGIKTQFLVGPLDGKKGAKNNKSSAEQRSEKTRKLLQSWEMSLMQSTTYSQVFLHLNVLRDCIKWKRSA